MPTYTEGSHKSQDALSEVMILVKEEAKTHDLNSLIAVSKCALAKKGVLKQSTLSILIRQGLFKTLRQNCHFLDPGFLNYPVSSKSWFIYFQTHMGSLSSKPVSVSNWDELPRNRLAPQANMSGTCLFRVPIFNFRLMSKICRVNVSNIINV